MRKTSITRLSNGQLLAQTMDLTRRERRLTLFVLDHLIEVERRRLYAGEGYRSMFAYCTECLGYSASAADRRICAARAIRQFPRVRQLLEKRVLTLSTLAVVARQLTPANGAEILGRVCGKSAREAEQVLAEIRGVVPVRERIRPVIALRRPARESAGENGAIRSIGGAGGEPGTSSGALPEAAPPSTEPGPNHSRVGSKSPHTVVHTQDTKQRSVTERRYRFEFSGSDEFLRKYQKTVALLSNSIKGRPRIEAVLEAVLDEYIDRHDPERRAVRRARRRNSARLATANSRDLQVRADKRAQNTSASACAPDLHVRGGERAESTSAPVGEALAHGRCAPAKQCGPSRHVPAAARDRVSVRDGGRCTFMSPTGERCKATHHLHVDHITPFARGGTHDPMNLRLLCSAHNALMARRDFGESHMAQFRRRE